MLILKPRYIYTIWLPLFLLVYICLAGYSKTFGDEEIFPFFSWSLFSGYHEKASHYLILIEEVNGKTVDVKDKLITAHNHRTGIRVEKALRNAINICHRYGDKPECTEAVESKLAPLVVNKFKGLAVRYSFGLCELDFEFVKARFIAADNIVPKFDDVQCQYKYKFGPYYVSQK